jgi:hypothetical protein
MIPGLLCISYAILCQAILVDTVPKELEVHAPFQKGGASARCTAAGPATYCLMPGARAPLHR